MPVMHEGAWNQGETMKQHIGVVWGRYPVPLQFFMPVDGATFFAIHENLSPCPLRVDVEGHPSSEECPLRQMHANPLPSVGSDRTFLACPPGSLVVSLCLIAGVALASTDATLRGVLQCQWFALGHKHHLMDVARVESYGRVMCWPCKAISRKKKSKRKPRPKSRKGKEKAGEEVEDVEEEQEEKNELWCICHQVFVVGRGHGWKCVVVIH